LRFDAEHEHVHGGRQLAVVGGRPDAVVLPEVGDAVGTDVADVNLARPVHPGFQNAVDQRFGHIPTANETDGLHGLLLVRL